MILWSFIAAALAALVVLGTFLYRRRRHKQERLQLRLVAGRSHLLSEELRQSLASLERFGQEDPRAVMEQAPAALDQLHLALVERQAHLQNCDELARLQQRRLALLSTSREEEARAPRAPAVVEPSPPAPRPTPAAPRDRRQIENQLLSRIEELQKGQEAAREPSPPRKKSGPSPQR